MNRNLSQENSKLIRVNLMLSREDSDWLDEFAEEVRHKTGARLSRSEIVRAALAALRELNALGRCGEALPIEQVRDGVELAGMSVLTLRKLASR